VDTLGHLLALHVTPANEQERAQVAELSQQVQQVTGDLVELVFVDQGYTGAAAAAAAPEQGIQLQVVTLPQAQRGFVLLPRRWVVERSFGSVPPPGAGLRAAGRNAGGATFRRLRRIDAHAAGATGRPKFIFSSGTLCLRRLHLAPTS
jgi:transposase